MGYLSKKFYIQETGMCPDCNKVIVNCSCELDKQIKMDSIINELKKHFSGDNSYLSGVNDGMYHLFRYLYDKQYL